MINRLVSLMILVALLVLSSVAYAQTGPQSRTAKPGTASTPAKFDVRDLSGVWNRTGGDRGVGPQVPPMTREGEKMLNANRPSYGRPLGSPLNGEHIGRVRAVPPAQGNSLIGDCNPMGIPRAYFDPEPVEFIQIHDRLLQFFSWTRILREIWTDGRQLPAGENLDNLGPRWYGYSAGRWEGDTFVVNTVGTDERTWLDHFGYPHSFEMRLEERFRRTGPDTLELKMTIYDPKVYTTPWIAETKTFTRAKKEDLTFYGWYGFLEGICAPIDEQDFNKRVRNPAGGVIDK